MFVEPCRTETLDCKIFGGGTIVIIYLHSVYYTRAQFVGPLSTTTTNSPLQMARAGFIHCPSANEPDVAKCFFCLIELEGWEPNDDPQ